MKDRSKILTVVGARPHFIKSAALTRAIQQSSVLSEVLVHSGQHYDHSMSGQFFQELGMTSPKYNLEVGSKLPNLQMADCIKKLDAVLEAEKPDLVLVIGDTNTTAAAAIATKKRNIALGHVEAGLREFDRSIPEEINKLITDAISDLCFCSTQTAIDNLKLAGITERVYLTGDISLDLLGNDVEYESREYFLARFELEREYAFMTCHRQSNTTERENLKAIMAGVSELDYPIIFAAHPRTLKAIKQFKLDHYISNGNIRLIEPLGFWDTQNMIRNAAYVITDSGGVIKESYFHEVPTITIDRQTEWLETIAEGWNVLVGPDQNAIVKAARSIKRPQMNLRSLGDGLAGQRIVKAIEEYLTMDSH